jgi:hypothetical protein
VVNRTLVERPIGALSQNTSFTRLEGRRRVSIVLVSGAGGRWKQKEL